MADTAIAEPLSTVWLAAVVRTLPQLHASGDAERVDQVRLLEELKSAAAAVQARVTTELVASQHAQQVDAGVGSKDVGRGVAAQVALAKRESPARARKYVGWSGILIRELPATLAALTQGRISEWKAQIVARETAWLSAEHRAQVDCQIAPHLESWGERQVEAEVKKAAYRLDPRGFLARTSKAEADRRVTLRPAPDTMSILSGLLPVAQGVAVFAALGREAESRRGGGDERSRGQIMADTLVERITGQATADAVPVQVNVVMTDQALFNHGAGSNEPATVLGHGTIPADLARRLAQDAEAKATLWLRRFFTAPDSGQLVAMDARSRVFPEGLAHFLLVRDQVCRTPWCDAPVRHNDHVLGVARGGGTEALNGQGLCVACNHAKEAPGWRARARSDPLGQVVTTVTPTGHRYSSRAPDPPGTSRGSPLERRFADLIATHDTG